MKTKPLIAALSTVLIASTVFASGDHAGGHHGDADAIGRPGDAAQVTRTITVDMTDAMRFTPANITANQGETIKFVVKNSGKLKHEMVLGTEKELKAHYEVMKKYPEMEHADENMVAVRPGESGEIIWQFTKAGKVSFACLHPGHYDAGMRGTVMVAANATPAEMTPGEVRRIDIGNQKITLKHGEIKNLGMPGMTMVFQVQDPAMLGTLRPGDKVLFKAEKAGGALVVTHMEAIQAP